MTSPDHRLGPPPPTPPGWYPDGQPGQVRWFDGHAWTSATQSVPEPASRPVLALLVAGLMLLLAAGFAVDGFTQHDPTRILVAVVLAVGAAGQASRYWTTDNSR